MSKYDPNALPFWEIERGDGYYTRLRSRQQKYGTYKRITDRTADPVPLHSTMNRDGNRWVTAPRAEA